MMSKELLAKKLFHNYFARHHIKKSKFYRYFSNTSEPVILGIESTCDDTGVTVLAAGQDIIYNELQSQNRINNTLGGIVPDICGHNHEKVMPKMIEDALKVLPNGHLSAVAIAVHPGLVPSIRIGVNFAKYLCRKFSVPLIPIHHMQAHTLLARMQETINFPFLALLISGGHALLVLVKSVEEFVLLGQGLDIAPGEAIDKVARDLCLRTLPGFHEKCGGVIMEKLAQDGDPFYLEMKVAMRQDSSCNFSFSGQCAYMKKIIAERSRKENLKGLEVLSDTNNLCASFQYWILQQLSKRLFRAMKFCEQANLIPVEEQTVVVAGGVSSNKFIVNGLRHVCENNKYRLASLNPKLCTDNGLMIAWNGYEKYRLGSHHLVPPNKLNLIHPVPKMPIGKNLIEEVRRENLNISRIDGMSFRKFMLRHIRA